MGTKRGHWGKTMIAKDVKTIAINTPEIKVPFTMKRNMVRPILMGLKEAIIRNGKIGIIGLGQFYVVRRKVSERIGSKEKKMILTVAFRPSDGFTREVRKAWSQKLQPEIVPAPISIEASAPSAPSTEQ